MKANRQKPILLICQGSVLEGMQVTPFGLLYVGQALKEAGFRVRIIDLRGGSGDKALAAAREEEPLFAGFGTFVSPFLKRDVKLSRQLHEMGVKVVWGGVFSSCLPEIPLRSGFVDYVVVGEGERPAVDLARAIAEGSEPAGIPGVGYRRGEEIALTPPAPPEPDLDRFRFGWDLIDWKDYMIPTRGGQTWFTRVPFSRGCPFRCSFCYNAADPSRQLWRAHSPEYMREMISFFRERYQVGLVHVMADNPFGKVKAGQEALSALSVKWTSPAHLSVLTPDFVDWAKSAGCVRLGLGLESGSDRVLKLMHKGFTADQIQERLAICRDKGLVIKSNWMTMIPGETPEDMRQTFALIEEIYETNPLHYTGLSIFRAYPGCELWDESLKLGLYEPKTLEEWTQYNGQIAKIKGYSKHKVLRIKQLFSTLYSKPKPINRAVPAFIRPRLVRRLQAAKLRGPVEEMLWARKKAADKLSRFTRKQDKSPT